MRGRAKRCWRRPVAGTKEASHDPLIIPHWGDNGAPMGRLQMVSAGAYQRRSEHLPTSTTARSIEARTTCRMTHLMRARALRSTG